MNELQPKHLQAYYAEALAQGRKDWRSGFGLSATSVRGHHRILSEALSHAVKWGLAVRNVAQAVDPPRPERKEMQTLDLNGVHSFLEAVQDTPYYPLFHLAVHTGLRRSELLGLRWKDVTSIYYLSLWSRCCSTCGMGVLSSKNPKLPKAVDWWLLHPHQRWCYGNTERS